MDLSVVLGVAVIGYALYVIVTRMLRAKAGKCSGCPYAGDCARRDGHRS